MIRADEAPTTTKCKTDAVEETAMLSGKLGIQGRS
jgi:hypothetical protein